MNEKAKPQKAEQIMSEDTMESIDRFTETFSTENVSARGGDEDNNFGRVEPAFYTMLLFSMVSVNIHSRITSRS
jgi:hypothetical protein